nr:MAG TPA: hypothetical protein [Caudoviricetes sp.]
MSAVRGQSIIMHKKRGYIFVQFYYLTNLSLVILHKNDPPKLYNMHKKIYRNKPLSARMSAGDEQKGPNVRGFRALSAPRGQIRRDVRGRTKIPPESAGDGRRGGTLHYSTTLKRT